MVVVPLCLCSNKIKSLHDWCNPIKCESGVGATSNNTSSDTIHMMMYKMIKLRPLLKVGDDRGGGEGVHGYFRGLVIFAIPVR